MKFNHDAENVTEIIEGHTPDKEKVQELIKQMLTDPASVFGRKKSQTAEYIHENANDPDVLTALSFVMVTGLEAVVTMAALEQESKKAMAAMDIDPRMPEEMKEAIRQAKKDVGVSSDTEDKPQTEETTDEFEQLKRKYQ